MRAVMALADRVLVLHHGAKIAEGAPAEVVRDPAVIDSIWARRRSNDPSRPVIPGAGQRANPESPAQDHALALEDEPAG